MEDTILNSLIEKLKPKAHDAIDRIVDAWETAQQTPSVLEGMSPDVQNTIQNLVMGRVGGGGPAKDIRQLVVALKGKIKGGKMIPSQPIRKGTVGGPNLSKLDILLNKLKDNPNIGGNINRVMRENVKKYKPKK